jgi:hypothetical protein
MNRSKLAKIAALVVAGVAATVTTLTVIDHDGHHGTAASLKVGQPSPSPGPAPAHAVVPSHGSTPTTHGHAPAPHGHVPAPPPAPSHPTATFTLSGSVTGLYPGATRDLTVRITNPGNVALRVTSVRVTVRDASAACRASNLVAWSYSGRAYVARHGTASVTVPVRMVPTALDACQNATFPLVFHAEAVKA